MSETDEEKWDKIASENADKVLASMAYYRKEIQVCSNWDRRLSTAVLLLGVVTPVLVTLAANKAIGDHWILALQVGSVLASGALAFLEGLKKIFSSTNGGQKPTSPSSLCRETSRTTRSIGSV